MSSYKSHYSYIILGAGSAGLTVAVGLSKLKKDILVVAKDIGGECTHTGCVPSKTFLSLAMHYVCRSHKKSNEQLRRDVFKMIREKVEELETEDLQYLTDNDIPFLLGTASFLNRKTIEVHSNEGGKKHTITFDRCIIATGSSAVTIDIPGIPARKILTNESLFELRHLPERVVIFGGGPIGTEIGTAFSKFEVETSLIVRSELISYEPREMVAVVRESIQKYGGTVYEGVKSQEYDHQKRQLILKDSHNNEMARIPEADYYLMALGRTPNTAALNLERAGIEYARDGIIVNQDLETSQPHIWAIGDVTQSPKFTHLANNHGKFIIQKVLMPWVHRTEPLLPACTFSDPPIASVGIKEESLFVKKFIVDFSKSDRGKIENATQETGAIFVDMIRGRIVGASLVGHFAEHAISFFTLAITKKMSVFELQNFVIPYPTIFDGLQQLYRQFLSVYPKELPGRIFAVLTLNSVRIITAVFWVGIAGAVFWYLQRIGFDTARLATDLEALFRTPAGMLLFVITYSLRAMISFSAVVLSALGGALYGFWGGLILTLIASNLSSAVAYWLGRTVFSRTVENERAHSITRTMRKSTFETVLFLRLAAFPYDLLSYIAGSLKAPFGQFITATAIGSLPGSIAIVSFGASLKNITDISSFKVDPFYLSFSVILFIGSILISLIVRRAHFRNLD